VLVARKINIDLSRQQQDPSDQSVGDGESPILI
jgi:hypothetical protein